MEHKQKEHQCSITHDIGVKDYCPALTVLHTEKFHIKNLKLFRTEKRRGSNLSKAQTLHW